MMSFSVNASDTMILDRDKLTEHDGLFRPDWRSNGRVTCERADIRGIRDTKPATYITRSRHAKHQSSFQVLFFR